mmetsp:Transcript_19492/g.49560  ORF Transcript_19492/g.49560 Transcript_19492/m.49560 type:complete len:153 (+) Transcript_19492:1499-1957(+)
MRKAYFEKGAERLVRKFREVDAAGNFVSPLLVAKEGCFQRDLEPGNGGDVAGFHKTFCDTQTRASTLAEQFNKLLAALPGVGAITPRVFFLKCSVYVLEDGVHSLFRDAAAILVEKQLNISRYQKWNDNKGRRALDAHAAKNIAGRDHRVGR